MILCELDVLKTYTGQPYPAGWQVLSALTGGTEPVILYSTLPTMTTSFMDFWVKRHSNVNVSSYICETRPLVDWIPSQRPKMLLTANPTDAAWATSYGLSAVLFCQGALALPEYTVGSVAWDTLVAEIDRQKGIEPMVWDESEVPDGFEL